MSSRDLTAKGSEMGRPLTGWRVLGILTMFFGVIAAVNAVLVYSALSTFSGEVVSQPYERGIAYNHDIASAREQATRGWKVDASLERLASGETKLMVEARDANGAAITDARLLANLESPTNKRQDVVASLQEISPGHFEALVALAPGARDLVLTASRDGRELFRSRNRLLIE